MTSLLSDKRAMGNVAAPRNLAETITVTKPLFFFLYDIDLAGRFARGPLAETVGAICGNKLANGEVGNVL